MSTSQNNTGETESDRPVALKRKSSDVGWNYGKLCDPLNKEKVKCDFCGHISTGGINRFKLHITGTKTSVVPCKRATPEAKTACNRALIEFEAKKAAKIKHAAEVRADVQVTAGDSEGRDARESVCVGSTSSDPTKLGPMDKFVRAIDGKSSKEEALKQLSMNEALFKERRAQCSPYVARWVYSHGIPFNALDNDEFMQMCEAIGKFGPGYEPPSQYELREKLLNDEYARTKSLLAEREKEKIKLGCTIMTDAWTDMKRRSIMNLCTHCSGGTSFLKSKDTSDVSHTSEVIFQLVDSAIEEVGAEHVMQVCTDNASNNMGAKKMLFEKRPKIFWSSCATHTINLMLQGIGNLKRFKSTIDQAKNLTIFIYAHHKTLALMRVSTRRRDIIRPGVTRFASAFLTLQSLLEKKDALRSMVVERAWEEMSHVKTKKGKDATATVMDAAFWKGVILSIKVFEPLVRVLRLVDGDIKPSMAWLFGELELAKVEMKDAFGCLERNYKDTMAIVDKKMKGRLDSPLHMAAYVLNPHYSYTDSSIFTSANEGFIKCAEQYYADDYDTCNLVVNEEFLKFENKEGAFGKKLATSSQNKGFNPVGWWKLYGGETPNLQKMAMRILSLTSSSSGCERNWSAFESIHTKRRNRLTTERCNNLVFIRFNNRMLSRKQKLLEKKKWDVLISTDATEAQGFLFDGGDDHATVVYLDEEDGDVHPGTGISWDLLGEAMGTQEQLQRRRSARVRDLEEEEFESDHDEETEVDEEIDFEDDD